VDQLSGLFENFGLEPSTAFRLVPIDPSEPMVIGNARLVPKKTRMNVLKAWSVLKRFGSLEEEDSDVNPRCKYMAVLQLECVEKSCNSRDLVKKDLDEVDDEPCSKPVVDHLVYSLQMVDYCQYSLWKTLLGWFLCDGPQTPLLIYAERQKKHEHTHVENTSTCVSETHTQIWFLCDRPQTPLLIYAKRLKKHEHTHVENTSTCVSETHTQNWI
jgi:hypothetical protein